MNYATAQNLRGETLAECCERIRRERGLFAESYAMLWAGWFENKSDNGGDRQLYFDMCVFYRVVAKFIAIGIDLDQWREKNGH